MSLPRPSGLKIPSKIGKPSGLPQMKSGIPAPGPTLKAQSPELPEPPPPVDDFIIGDRVWVSGTKPGYIAFLGETRFAAGEWAGVVLDEPVGKNDGAVQGARYFQCPPNRGVFSKISKLSRTPGRMAMTTPVPRQDDMLSESDLNMRATNGTNSTLPRNRPTTPRGTLSGTRMSSGSTSSLNKSVSPATSTPNLTRQTPVKSPGFKVGDRVLVSGTKPGTLRYMGPADFAKGEWVGVELDEKLGKNDGAVAGKRYFDCQPMFGLFAPVHKVTRLPGPGFAGGTPQTRSGMSTSMRLTRERSGSQESISSLSSTASSVSRSRAKTSQRPSTLNVSATTSALQKALKEKEEHIEQLLRERDLERAEVARAAAQIDDTENQLTRIKTERERFQGEVDESVLRMQDVIQSLEQKNHELNEKLEDEKRKVEDLQFQIEEEMLSKDDVMASTGVDETKLHELEKDLKRQKEKAEKTTQELASLKTKYEQQVNLLKSSEETATTYLDQMEELTHKLSQAENKIRTFESSRLEEGAKTSQVSMDLADKSAKVKELEDLIDSRNKELAHLHIRLGEVEEDLKTSNSKRERLQETCDSLTNRLSASDQAAEKMNAEILDLRNQVGDLQREVQANIERNEQLTDEKNKQELQLDDLMKNSGDSSERLSMLGQQIKDKTRKLEALQANLSSSTQKWAKLNEQFEQLQQEKEKEKISITCKYEETITALKIQLEDMQNEAEKNKTKMKKMSEDFEKDKEDTINRKVDEINELKKQLQHNVDELSKQEIQTQAHREVLDQMTLEKESFKFEKEKVEKHLKRVEEEKEAMNHELIQAKVETSKIQSKWAELTSEKDNYREQLEDMKTEQEKINKARQQLTKQWEDSSSEKQALGKEKDKLSTELLEAKASLQQRDIQIEELHKKIEILNSESSEQKAVLEKLSNEAATTSTLQTQMDEMGMKVTGLEEELKQSQAENDSMRAQLEFYNLLAEEKNRLENQNNDLNRKLAEMEQSKQMDKVHAEKDALQGETDNMTGLVKKQEEELDTQRKQIINLKNENSSIVTYKTTTQSLEKERLELQDRIVRLEALLAESKANANVVNNMDTSENSVITRLKEEKLTAEQQVEFLNSVIVDLQSKNEKLKIRLDAMETGVVNGDSSQAMEIVSPNKRVAPRLFCDICDEFDKHDTDDCPLQAMSDSPPPSINHGDRKSTRPYCDTCEEFHDPCIQHDSQPDDRNTHVTGEETDDRAADDNWSATNDKEDGVEIDHLKEFTDFIKTLKHDPANNKDPTTQQQQQQQQQQQGPEADTDTGGNSAQDTDATKACTTVSDCENTSADSATKSVDILHDSGISMDDNCEPNVESETNSPGVLARGSRAAPCDTNIEQNTTENDSEILPHEDSDIAPCGSSDSPSPENSAVCCHDNQTDAPGKQSDEVTFVQSSPPESKGAASEKSDDAALTSDTVIPNEDSVDIDQHSNCEDSIGADSHVTQSDSLQTPTREKISSTSGSDYMSGNEDFPTSGDEAEEITRPESDGHGMENRSENHTDIEAAFHEPSGDKEPSDITGIRPEVDGYSSDGHLEHDGDSKEKGERPESCTIS